MKAAFTLIPAESRRLIAQAVVQMEEIKIAKEKAVEHKTENVYFAKSIIFDERHKKGSFDAIMAFNILHLLDNPDKAIKRINDLLKDVFGDLFK